MVFTPPFGSPVIGGQKPLKGRLPNYRLRGLVQWLLKVKVNHGFDLF
mgnify:CR=1 FL=1